MNSRNDTRTIVIVRERRCNQNSALPASRRRIFSESNDDLVVEFSMLLFGSSCRVAILLLLLLLLPKYVSIASGISWIALEARYTHLQDVLRVALTTSFLVLIDDHCSNHEKNAKLIAFPILAAIANRPISLDHLFSSVYSRIVLTQAAQHELKPKSTIIQYTASDERVGHVCAPPMDPRQRKRVASAICKLNIPPSESMTGPRNIFPAAIESVDSARRRDIISSRENFALL